jgi:hypothetical protein
MVCLWPYYEEINDMSWGGIGGYCSSSAGIREYGSSSYCLANESRNESSSSSSSVSAYDGPNDRGDSQGYASSSSASHRGLGLLNSAGPVEVISLQDLGGPLSQKLEAVSAQLPKATQALAASTQNLQASTQLKAQNVLALNSEADHLQSLIDQCSKLPRCNEITMRAFDEMMMQKFDGRMMMHSVEERELQVLPEPKQKSPEIGWDPSFTL